MPPPKTNTYTIDGLEYRVHVSCSAFVSTTPAVDSATMLPVGSATMLNAYDVSVQPGLHGNPHACMFLPIERMVVAGANGW